ncbi:uncharacterized protein LOC62_07G009140 [Vanrija pseudolonga]|uniref:Uncharacterized protein n=1 Tax=Vanrija pseudolonga TaxID=143232 RepID=A0AAF0YL34_9TREE|nr:hypothetical protein LOC62_07G009140 [Vanrija pseudolonga]
MAPVQVEHRAEQQHPHHYLWVIGLAVPAALLLLLCATLLIHHHQHRKATSTKRISTQGISSDDEPPVVVDDDDEPAPSLPTTPTPRPPRLTTFGGASSDFLSREALVEGPAGVAELPAIAAPPASVPRP